MMPTKDPLATLFCSMYCDTGRATHMLQRCGVGAEHLNPRQAASVFWTEAFALADRLGLLPKLVNIALADKSVAAFHGQLRTAWQEREKATKTCTESATVLNERASVPWNWCPRCKQTVDDDMRTGEFRDGSEGTCLGCKTVYVAVAYQDDSWALVPREESNLATVGEADVIARRAGQNGPRLMPVGSAAASMTEDEIDEFERDASTAPDAWPNPLTRRLAAEVRALRAEVARIPGLEQANREAHQAIANAKTETMRLRGDLAARPIGTDTDIGAHARERLSIILPHLKAAAANAVKTIPGGQVLLAIIAKSADGSGQITCDFESATFLSDLETLVLGAQ